MRKYPVKAALLSALLLTGTGFITPSSSLSSLTKPVGRTTTPALLTAPEADYSTIDRYARSAPESQARSMASLARYLTAPARSELAKARVIYAWILSHVRYDEGVMRMYTSEAEYANRALQSRRTVCTGYALLYKYMLREVGIDAVNIKGYSRTDDATAGRATGPVDHEWNAVKIDGDWYLCDLTWAATTAKNGKPNDHYFLTDPQAFVSQHLPVDARWQLLNTPVSKTAFDQFPRLFDTYFTMGFDSRFPRNGLIRTSDMATITLYNEADLKLTCSLGGGGQYTQPLPYTVQRNGDAYTISFRVPGRGASTVFVFAKPRTATNTLYQPYQAVASFTVVKG
jgi:Transglutaminase-like superfamily